MANLNQHKIGCYLGGRTGTNSTRTKIIDPNSFYGEVDSSRNIPVRLEDLTISVKLTTTKKSRTTIFSNTNENNSIVKQQKGITINFIEGSDVNDKKVLTTKFTDLTTVFETDMLNPETFGISNIDIDFNSSYVPMIKIDFIDVRGSSIFQNEESLLNSETQNKYATFFEFPYPLFELEIKGYYGQPVTYCLHMLKFNSKFNSQTGNFEISCDFIGYTYALLSDMLIGVLKAIPYTKIGSKKFKKYNDERILNGLPPILDLVDLKTKINEISQSIKKVAATSEESKVINTFNQAIEILETIKINYLGFSDEFNINKKPNSFEPDNPIFVILSGGTFTNLQNERYFEINKLIKNNIKKLNDLKIQGLSINENDLSLPIKITNLQKKMLEPDYELAPFSNLKTPSDVELFKSNLKQFIDSYVNLSSDFVFSVFDLRSRFTLIQEKIDLARKSLDDNNKILALRLKDTVNDSLGFNPTVRNIIEIFTNLIEIFIETIYDVSYAAERNVKRNEIITNVFSNSSNKSDYINNNEVYPWPAYSEKNDTKAYVDKYLGSNSEIKFNISNINELEFIDDLLYAFLIANKQEKQSDLLNTVNNKLYIPCNPLDTVLYGNSGNPYIRKGEIINQNQALRILLIRAITFLGYSNNQDYLTSGDNGEIQKMAELEAKTMFESLNNINIKILFKNITLDRILSSTGVISNTDRKVIEFIDDDYFYNYAPKSSPNSIKLLPVGYDLNGQDINIFVDETNHPKQTGMINYADDGNLFLTNYSSSYGGSGTSTDNFKFEDGGIYIDIKTVNEYSQNLNSLLFDTTLNTQSILDLKSLESNSIASAGFNSFGGIYGIQDFNNINYGSDSGIPENTPAMFVFYSNDGMFSGLSEIRKKGVSSKWDFKKNGLNLYGFNQIESHKSIYYSNGNSLTGDFLHNNLGKNRTLATTLINEPNKISYSYINHPLNVNSNIEYYLPLFGSKFYYIQKNSIITKQDNTTISNLAEYYVKGLLFLNTIPFNINYEKNEDPFNKIEIKHLFDIKSGFIHAPRLWVAYVGGLLWWLSKENPIIDKNTNQIIGGGRGKNDPIIWNHACSFEVDIEDSLFKAPEENQYLPKFLLGKRNEIEENSLLLTLPIQVKNKFKKVFFDFINGSNPTDFKQLADKLEIYKGSPTNFCNILNRLTKFKTIADSSGLVLAINSGSFIDSSSILDNLVNVENYKIITPLDETKQTKIKLKYIFLELNKNSDISNNLLNLFKEELIIVNTGVKIWDTTNQNNDLRVSISVKKNIFEEYLNKFISTIKDLTKDVTKSGEEQKQINEVFGSTNKDEIKLMLYKHCKNIYDKWLGGVDDVNNAIFQCGDNTRNGSNRKTTDLKLSNKGSNNNNLKPRLIDSFRFVTRSFKDIGDELFINPISIADQITDFPNTPAYSVISGLLNDNKFEFIALPTFINYRDSEMLESVFTPYEYNSSITSCGPSFVCVYTGQRSNTLDLGNLAKYPNDGFDMRCINGQPDPSIPSDFSEPLNDYEDPVSVFEVNYSQQNQNIFKNIILDQSEYIETEESLKIIEDISTKGFENKPSFAGQNMYNIYAVRSYSAEIEMLGNAMIQPMMYFQLNNIPMFHGAYMITRTKHNIKPNHMTTSFTGVRIRAIESPIIDVAEAYMNLIETLDLGSSVSTSAIVSGTGTAGDRSAKKSIPCNGVKKSTTDFIDILKLVVEYLEGSYCSGGSACGSDNSGETLWGLDRKNHTGPLDNNFWVLVDQNKNKPRKWNSSFPKPKDEPIIFEEYSKIIELDYNKFVKTYIKNQNVLNLIESDGRLKFNVIYAVFNGAGWFKGFAKILENEYNLGKKTSEELLKVFVDERISGGRNALKGVNQTAATLIANTGVDIEKLVGLSPLC